ncbi:feruloyl-CoA synthase [Psychromarinibacter halotolerans]|uniref:Feruloyl-CoA synthase n=1 Tax=Psychromarinibacter halotolerans TaxID=1775175 RepID=A0ABV7GXZ0_9RHOB|nr:feruloyl-CoA synthase [Psychromarinibacter halotolerans]MDF0598325.1 feruloyl-CoA synthase [Psychromarinibacter halotolerans]
MTESSLRSVELWDAEVEWEKRDDGSILVWQKGELNPYPDRMSDRIKHWAETAPDRIWMAERGPDTQWYRVSYAQLLADIRAIGQVLLDLGLSEERPLLILSGNSIAHAVMALGAQYVGVPSAAIAPAYALVSDGYEKLKSVRDQITPGAVFAENMERFAPAVDAVMPDLPRLGVEGDGLAMSWEDVLDTTPTDAVEAANAATGPDTVAKFVFTSGTTGNPKAVTTTQRMLCSNQEIVADCFRYFRSEPPVLLDWAPWNHVAAGNKVFNMCIYHGGTYYLDGGKPAPGAIDLTIRNLLDVSPNWYFNVPVGYEMLVHAMKENEELRKSFFKNLKLMMYAGAAMAEHTWADLDRLAIETTGERVLLATGLGSTETAPFAFFCTEPQDKPGNIGIPSREVVLKLVPNEGKWEARVKSPSITPGYWRDPKTSAEHFDEEGFYLMGDALRFADPDDPSKGFFFDGRVAENFKLATGTWVSVGTLRAKLTDALGGLARDVVIVGEGHESLGAMLVPFRPAIEKIVDGGASMDDETLFNHPTLRSEIATRLAAYNKTATGSSMRIPQVIVMTDPLNLDRGEVTDKGSVNQRAVLRNHAEFAMTLYTDDDHVIFSGQG